jgi:hypothetical protein
MTKARKKAGFTQHEVARRLKKPQSFVPVRGRRAPHRCRRISGDYQGADPAKIVRALTGKRT